MNSRLPFIYDIPVFLRGKPFVYCPTHTDTALTRILVPASNRGWKYEHGMCEDCIRRIFAFKRPLQDGCANPTQRVRMKVAAARQKFEQAA